MLGQREKENLASNLESIQTGISDPGAMLRSMLVWIELGQTAKAKTLSDGLTMHCKGYAEHPIIAKLYSS